MKRFLISLTALIALCALLSGCVAPGNKIIDRGADAGAVTDHATDKAGTYNSGSGASLPVTSKGGDTAPGTGDGGNEPATEPAVTTGAEPGTGEEPAGNDGKPFTLAVTGDISFADNWEILQNAVKKGYGTEDFIGTSLLEKMRAADILMVNNEFCFSDRGEPLPGKYYTFRGATANVRYLHEIGADIACLANNHVYDFGDDAFADTMTTLRDAGIPYIGAGMNENEAYAPYYTEVNGVKLAFLAASMAEKSFYKSRVAVGDTLGIAGIFDETRFIKAIEEANGNADYVIVYAHWGTEYSETLLKSQTTLAHKFIDSGADIVLGAHAHILQGMEYYDGKPILYNLGNYWFNMKDLNTMLVRIEFADGGFEICLDPARQNKGITSEITGSEARRAFFDHLEEISVNVSITNDGRIYQRDL